MSDLTDLTADLPTLQRASNEIGEIADSLITEQRILHRGLSSFLDGDWTGPAAEAFRRHYHEWVEAAAGLLGALGDEAALIDGVRQLVGDRDVAIARDLDRLVVRLGVV